MTLLPPYYEKLARRKVLKRSLLGRVILGIQGVKQRNWDVLYLIASPVDALIVMGKRISPFLGGGTNTGFVIVLCMMLVLVRVLEHWPEVVLFRLLFFAVSAILMGFVVVTLVRIFGGPLTVNCTRLTK